MPDARSDFAPVSEAVTRSVRVEVMAQHSPGNSHPSQGEWVFQYTVRITNEGSGSVQLISRHWIITDANDTVQEVRGLGVIGEQPLLKPGEHFEYTSGTALATPVGTMHGEYQMVTEDGTQFDARIPEFTLTVPRVLH